MKNPLVQKLISHRSINLVPCYTFVMRLSLLFIVGLITGCTHTATYPPVEGSVSVALSNSSSEPVPTIFSLVISYSHKHYGGMETIVFNLPKGINKEVYSMVSGELGDANPMSTPNEIAYHITELRLRGFSAEADVLFPQASGGYGMSTVRLATSVGGDWGVVEDRVWLILVNQPPPPNHLGSGGINP